MGKGKVILSFLLILGIGGAGTFYLAGCDNVEEKDESQNNQTSHRGTSYPSMNNPTSTSKTTSNKDTSSSANKYVVEIAERDYCFIDASEITDESELVMRDSKPISFDVIKDYYLLFEFKVTSRENIPSEEYAMLTTVISLGNSKFVEGRIQYADGNQQPSEETIKDPNTSETSLSLRVNHKIPTKKDSAIKVKIVVKMSTLKAGETYLKFSFEGNNILPTGESNDFTRLMTINKVQFDAPVISFDDINLKLKWKHVHKNVDFYIIYVDGVLDTENQYLCNEWFGVGAELSWDISPFVSKQHSVKIQAISNSANFIASNYSNEVDVNL